MFMSQMYASVRRRAVEIGLTEVARDVREDLGPNQGAHIDKYFKWTYAPTDAGLNWCGMFVNYCFRRAAEEYGVNVPWGNTTFWKGSTVTSWACANTDVLVDQYPIYPGDIYVTNKGHIGMVRATTAEGSGVLYTIDGNQSTYTSGGKSLKTRTRYMGDLRIIIRI
jgi:hypothetical protein